MDDKYLQWLLPDHSCTKCGEMYPRGGTCAYCATVWAHIHLSIHEVTCAYNASWNQSNSAPTVMILN